MKIVVQRVNMGKCSVDNQQVSSIDLGLLLLVGFERSDTLRDVQTLAKKVVKLRIFEDEQGKMNLDVLTSGGRLSSLVRPQRSLA